MQLVTGRVQIDTGRVQIDIWARTNSVGLKDGGLPFINVDINKCEPNGPYILGTLFNVHLWFWWYT